MFNRYASLTLARTGLELKQFFRSRDSVIFTFLFPVIMLAIFGAVFNKEIAPGVTFTQYFTAGMVASGVALASFQSLALWISQEREDGTLKRLRGTPMPAAAYFLGKIGLVIVTCIAETAILLAAGWMFFGLNLPSEPALWMRLGWLLALGSAAGTVLGIAFSSVPRSARSASAVVVPVILVLQFTSGVYFVYSTLPSWMQHASSFFPLKWLAQGMRSVFLPAGAESWEADKSWQTGQTALVLAAWTLAGLLLCMKSFRWQRRDAG